MEKNLSTIIKQLIDTAWRRRMLLLVPLLVMLPVSLLAVKFLPRTYVATALMAMQESNRDNPFVKGTGVDYTLVKRIAGLEAWLKSEYVLREVLTPFTDLDPQKNPRAFLAEIEDARLALKLELVGNDFLRFTLRDGNPVGLGKKLNAITSKFLESLLLPDQSIQSAAQVVLQHYRNQLIEVRKMQRELDLMDPRKTSDLKEKSRTALMRGQQHRLKELQDVYTKKDKKLVGLPQHDAAGREPRSLQFSIENEALLQGGSRIGKLYELEAKKKTPNANNPRLSKNEKRRLVLNRREQSIRLRLSRASERLANVNVQNPLGILNAPEGIKIIDPAKDPLRPTTSGTKIMLAGIMGAIFLGLGLTTVAEMTDQRLHNTEEISEITGVPIIGRLPNIDGEMAKSVANDNTSASG